MRRSIPRKHHRLGLRPWRLPPPMCPTPAARNPESQTLNLRAETLNPVNPKDGVLALSAP